MLKYLGVARGRVTIAGLLALITVNRSHKGDKLARDNPVEVTILNLLIMLILSSVKFIKIIPLHFDTELETLKAVLYGTFVRALSFTSISKGQ